MKTEIYDICVVGAGVAGLFVASKLSQNGFNVLLLETSYTGGGQLNLYKDKHIYNIPMVNEITAIDVYKHLKYNCDSTGNCTFLFNIAIQNIRKDEKSNDFIISVKNAMNNNDDNLVRCKYLIFAFGKGMHIANKLQIPSASDYENKTLFYNIEDRLLCKNKNVVIAGGGDSAIDWAVELADIATKIVVIHRREINKVDNQQFQKFCSLCQENKIILKTPYLINELHGKNGILQDIEAVNINNNEKEIISCDYLFPFYGIKAVKNDIISRCDFSVNETENGIIVDYKTCEILGCQNVFAVGDCCCYEDKINNIPVAFFDSMKCFYAICKNSGKLTNFYGKR